MLLVAPILASHPQIDPSLLGLIQRYGDLRADLARSRQCGHTNVSRLEQQAAQVFARISARLQPAMPTVATEAMAGLNLRAYEDDPTARTAYLVVDMHGVSVGVQRRASDLYVHLDTSETADEVVSVEINGGGEEPYATR